MCAQFSNDAKGIQYVSSDSGQILFNRPELTATGTLTSGQVTVDVAGWTTSADAPTLYMASGINANTGAVPF